MMPETQQSTYSTRQYRTWDRLAKLQEAWRSWATGFAATPAWQPGSLLGHTAQPPTDTNLQGALAAGQGYASGEAPAAWQQGTMLGVLCKVPRQHSAIINMLCHTPRHQAFCHIRGVPLLLAAGSLLSSGIRALHKSALRKPISAAPEQPASSSRRWFQLTALGFGLVASCIWGYRRATGPDISGPQVYMDFQTGGHHLGRVVVGLYETSVPDAVANFRGLAGGDAGYGYKGSPVHRAVKGYIIMAGDITSGDGSGGIAYNTPRFIPAHNVGSTWHKGLLAPSAVARHDRGTVSLLLEEDGAVRSQFTIGCMAMPRTVDESMLPIGRVMSGMMVVEAITHLPVDSSHRPRTPVTISDCGVLPDDSSSTLSTTSST